MRHWIEADSNNERPCQEKSNVKEQGKQQRRMRNATAKVGETRWAVCSWCDIGIWLLSLGLFFSRCGLSKNRGGKKPEMKGEGRHAPQLECRERGASGQDLEHTCHDKSVAQVPGGSRFGSLKGDGKSWLLRHAQLPQRTRMLAKQT